MKKVFTVILVSVLCISLIACSDSTEQVKLSASEENISVVSNNDAQNEVSMAMPSSNEDSQGIPITSSAVSSQSDDSISDSEAVNAEESDLVENPAFSGDVIQLFNLNTEEALDALGDGSRSSISNFISNESIGTTLSLTNTVNDTSAYYVNSITISQSNDVNFFGIYVGDTLKEGDKILMDNGAKYRMSLQWDILIDNIGYKVQIKTSDDTTIESITVYTDETVKAQLEMESTLDNPFAYEEDLHSLESYWN